jgi:hypothetical protein
MLIGLVHKEWYNKNCFELANQQGSRSKGVSEEVEAYF